MRQPPAIVEKFKTLVEQNATLGEVNEWGKRRLAYPINHKNEGYYVLMTFESKTDFPAGTDPYLQHYRRHYPRHRGRTARIRRRSSA